MKKKVVVLITALVMVLACALGLVACGDDFDEGTYVMYYLSEEGGEKVAVSIGEMKLSDGKVTSEMVGNGTYKVDGDKLTITISGQAQAFTKKSNMWQAAQGDAIMALVKKGSTPSGYEVIEDDDL